jgi:hypothetical protein
MELLEYPFGGQWLAPVILEHEHLAHVAPDQRDSVNVPLRSVENSYAKSSVTAVLASQQLCDRRHDRHAPAEASLRHCRAQLPRWQEPAPSRPASRGVLGRNARRDSPAEGGKDYSRWSCARLPVPVDSTP